MHTVQSSEPALPFRSDTILGVCEAIGQDFGFHANWLRVALGSVVVWNPWAAFGLYLGLGLIVGLSRLVAPSRLESVPAGPCLASETLQADNQPSADVALAA